MGVSRHENINVLVGKFSPGLEEGGHVLEDVALGLDGPKTSVSGHLIVAAAAGVELATDRTDDLGQTTLVGSVNVLIAGLLDKLTGGPFGMDLLQSRDQLGAFVVGDNSSFVDGLGIGNRSADILGPHSCLENAEGMGYDENICICISNICEYSFRAHQSKNRHKLCTRPPTHFGETRRTQMHLHPSPFFSLALCSSSPLVKAQTLVELLHDGVGPTLEASAGAEQSTAGSRWCCLF